MLDKALYKKHTRLILYMAKRKYFSQKEIIDWSLLNGEFKDKDSIENKGQFRDKLISHGTLKKYTYKEFLKRNPDEARHACAAYTDPQERKRCLLEFDPKGFIALDYPRLKDIDLPFCEYADFVFDSSYDFHISDIVKAFVLGCSIQKVIPFSKKFSEDMKAIIQVRPEVDERLLPLVEAAKETMEKMLRKRIENRFS
ncbi:MAG: hypothetical protein NDI94_02065 [Candidatus Woesearchaeota archaeon]|nr:hypothetical protein [Candidatus Woesearchaeota archaeon]